MKRASDIGFIIGFSLVLFYLISLIINMNSYSGEVPFYRVALMMGLITLIPAALAFTLAIIFKIKSK